MKKYFVKNLYLRLAVDQIVLEEPAGRVNVVENGITFRVTPPSLARKLKKFLKSEIGHQLKYK